MSTKFFRWLKVFIIFLLFIPILVDAQEKKTKAPTNLDEASKWYGRACDLDPGNYAAFNNLGNVYFLKGFLDSAETYYLQANSILDSLESYYHKADTNKYKEIYKIHEGVLLNLGTLYAAADTEEAAYEMYSKVVTDSSDIPKVRVLLGLPFEEVDYTLAKKPDISAAKVEFLISKIIKKGKKQKDKKQTKSKKKKKESKILVRKGTKPKGKVIDVFYWIV